MMYEAYGKEVSVSRGDELDHSSFACYRLIKLFPLDFAITGADSSLTALRGIVWKDTSSVAGQLSGPASRLRPPHRLAYHLRYEYSR